MARTSKTKDVPAVAVAVAPQCENHCVKEHELGQLDARITSNERTGMEIKEAVQHLIDNHEKDKNSINERFTEISGSLAKMSAALDRTCDTNKELLASQNKMLDQVQQLVLDNQKVTNKQLTLEEAQAKQAAVSDSRYQKCKDALEEIRQRLTKLEQHKNTVMSIGALIISLLAAAGVIAQIFQAFGGK